MGGKYGNQRTCKGLFSRISYRLAQMEEAADTADEDKAFKILQHIIPDLVINGRSLSGNGFLAGRKSVADLKTLSPCDLYSNDRTASPHSVGSRATAGIRAGNELRTVAGAVAQTLRSTTPIHRVGHTSPGPGRMGAPHHPQTPALTPSLYHRNKKR